MEADVRVRDASVGLNEDSGPVVNVWDVSIVLTLADEGGIGNEPQPCMPVERPSGPQAVMPYTLNRPGFVGGSRTCGG